MSLVIPCTTTSPTHPQALELNASNSTVLSDLIRGASLPSKSSFRGRATYPTSLDGDVWALVFDGRRGLPEPLCIEVVQHHHLRTRRHLHTSPNRCKLCSEQRRDWDSHANRHARSATNVES